MSKKKIKSSNEYTQEDARLDIRINKLEKLLKERTHWTKMHREIKKGGGYIAYGSREDGMIMAPAEISGQLSEILDEQVTSELKRINTAIRQMFGMLPGGWPKEYDAT